MAWHPHCSSCSQRCWRCCLLENARQAGRHLGRCSCPACPVRNKQVTSHALQPPRTWACLCLLVCKSYQGAQILKNFFGHLTQGSAPTGSCLLQVHSWVMMVFLQAQRILDSTFLVSPSLLQDTHHNHIISPLNCSWRWPEHYGSFINLRQLKSALLSTGETNVHDHERQDLRCTVTQQKITTSHNPEKDVYCLVQGWKTPECPSAASVTLRKQKARRKKVLLTQLRAERGRKFRGMGARRKLWEKMSRDMFQEEVKIPLPPIRKVPLNLTL